MSYLCTVNPDDIRDDAKTTHVMMASVTRDERKHHTLKCAIKHVKWVQRRTASNIFLYASAFFSKESG